MRVKELCGGRRVRAMLAVAAASCALVHPSQVQASFSIATNSMNTFTSANSFGPGSPFPNPSTSTFSNPGTGVSDSVGGVDHGHGDAQTQWTLDNNYLVRVQSVLHASGQSPDGNGATAGAGMNFGGGFTLSAPTNVRIAGDINFDIPDPGRENGTSCTVSVTGGGFAGYQRSLPMSGGHLVFDDTLAMPAGTFNLTVSERLSSQANQFVLNASWADTATGVVQMQLQEPGAPASFPPLVPEPTGVALAAVAAFGLALRRRRV